MERHILVVRTRPKEGRDAEYNQWYDDIHLAEALAVKGFESARRFELSQIMLADEQEKELPYLAIYELETDDISATLDALRAAMPGMKISDSLDHPKSVIAFRAHDPLRASS